MDFDKQQADPPNTWRQSVANVLALFTSTGTLLCCALPSALAAVAGGSAVVSLVSAVPWLVPLSRSKEWIFLGAGLMIALSAFLTFRPKGKVACTIAGGEGCRVASRFQKAMFWLSAGVYGVGVFFAYGLLPMMKFLGA
jgi:di/tricarboxylate transporter